MIRRVVPCIFSAVLLLSAHCTSTRENKPAAMVVEKGTFEIIIPAFGELQAIKSTPIKAPQIRGRQTLAWMAPENASVKKGDVVARLSGTWIIEKIQEEEFAISKLDLEIAEKVRDLEKEKIELQNELDITVIEKEIAEHYTIKDETIYSKSKIIDDSTDLEFLRKKADHLKKNRDQLEHKARAELQLLHLKKKTHQVKLNQYKNDVELLEVKAPHDGLFIYQKNWRGEKPRVGNSLWGGYPLAKLPELSHMEAKVYVLESEAGGLKKDIPVTLVLDSAPGISFPGKVSRVDSIAKPVERDSPLKYFEVIVGLEKTDRDLMKPGGQVKVRIFVEKQDDVLAVPNQALFFEEGLSYLNIKKGSGFEKREVKTGVRSLTRTIITSGLSEGEEVILSPLRE